MRIVSSSFKVIAGLFVTLPVSFALFPTEKALATPPFMKTGAYEMPMSYSSCKEKALNLGNTLFVGQLEPFESSTSYQVAGTTAETSASIYCIKTSLGSTLVISSSSKYESTHGEAESIFNRILSIMQQ